MKYLNLFLLTILFFILSSSCGYETPVVNNVVYVGAHQANSLGKYGEVYKCSSDLSSCTSIDVSSLSLEVSDGITLGAAFGASISGTKNNLFIGAVGIHTNAGGLVKCSVDGANCSVIDVSYLNLTDNNFFGAALAATSNNLFVGAPGIHTNAGGVYKCSLDGTGCSEIDGSYLGFIDLDLFGASLLVSNNNLFIGAYGVHTHAGGIYKCDLDGTGCAAVDTNYLSLLDNTQFGVSLAASDSNLFVGAMNNNQGVYKCNLNGTGCEFIAHNYTVGVQIGNSLAIRDNNLFIGSSTANAYAGVVLKCHFDASDCQEVNNNITHQAQDFFGVSLFAQ